MHSDRLIIAGKTIQVRTEQINQADLKFYSENPRVYSVLNSSGMEPSQDEIEEYMCNLEHVKQLMISIKSNGGLIDPLIVRDGDLTVLEGNSRLAAYRLLCRKYGGKWGKVICTLLPSDIDDATIFALLGQYHIISRKDWDPYEQAHYLYRRNLQTELPIEYMAQELGLSKQKAEKMINVLKFMIQHNDLNKRHWSYYEEYLKNAQIKKFRQTNPDLDDEISNSIKADLIAEASHIRKLGEIAKVGDKQSKKIIQKIADGKIDIYEGYNEIYETGKLEDVVKKLKNFRNFISDKSFDHQVTNSEDIKEKSLFEIKKIIKMLDKIQKKLED